MSAMRILFCRSNPVAPDPRVEKEALALRDAGHDVQILGWDRSVALPSLDTFSGIPIVRLPIQADFGQGLANLPALIRWQLGLLAWLFQHRGEYDAIHACDFDTILPSLLAKFILRKKVIYDIFDFYADHLRRTPEWIKELIRCLDKWAVTRADAVILVDDARLPQIVGAKPANLVIIYNTPDDVNLDISPEFDAFPTEVRFRITYVGLLQSERGLFEVLDFVKHQPDVGFVLAGFGGDEAAIKMAGQDLSNVVYLGRIPYDRALRLSLAADVLFATYDPIIPNHRYSSANKLFEAMMLSKPVVVARHTNMDQIVEKFECGLVVDYGDRAQLERAFLRLANDVALRDLLGKNARRAYETNFGWPIMKERLVNLYAGLG